MDDDELDRAAQLGPFFELDRWTPDSRWRPLAELVERPDVLVERVEAARGQLAARSGVAVAEVEQRATASIVFLGLAARLVSPAFGCAALAEHVPDLRLETMWWQPGSGSPWPLARSGSGATEPSGDLAHDLDSVVLVRVVAPVLEAFASTFSLSPQVLWGNVASSLSGAQTMLAAGRPARAAAGSRIITGLLARGSLRDTGDVDVVRPGFVRRSCCLFYRVPRVGVCGDCVLDHAPTPAPRGSMEPHTPGGSR